MLRCLMRAGNMPPVYSTAAAALCEVAHLVAFSPWVSLNNTYTPTCQEQRSAEFFYHSSSTRLSLLSSLL